MGVPDAVAVPDVELVADCSRCFGLCCVVPAFAASADFAISKPAETPCPNLATGAADFGCRIHSELRERGFAGCTAYDCFGAGQRLSQVTFGGVSWRRAPRTAPQLYAAFPVLRELHELLWYLTESATLVSGSQAGAVSSLLDEVGVAAASDGAALVALDLADLRARVGALLTEVSGRVRLGQEGEDLSRHDLAGVDLRRRPLRGACLRSALLIGADLRGVDLARADLLGADLRGARLEGADLRAALFLTRSQVGSAVVDRTTRLPPRLEG